MPVSGQVPRRPTPHFPRAPVQGVLRALGHDGALAPHVLAPQDGTADEVAVLQGVRPGRRHPPGRAEGGYVQLLAVGLEHPTRLVELAEVAESTEE